MTIQNAYNEWAGIYDSNENLTRDLDQKVTRNELHPFKQYAGTKARFERGEEIIELNVFIHHISDFTNSASANGLKLVSLKEYWHEMDENKPPRLVSFIFERP
jgi:hypothetical protein